MPTFDQYLIEIGESEDFSCSVKYDGGRNIWVDGTYLCNYKSLVKYKNIICKKRILGKDLLFYVNVENMVALDKRTITKDVISSTQELNSLAKRSPTFCLCEIFFKVNSSIYPFSARKPKCPWTLG